MYRDSKLQNVFNDFMGDAHDSAALDDPSAKVRAGVLASGNEMGDRAIQQCIRFGNADWSCTEAVRLIPLAGESRPGEE
jgi:hypothetical protein